MTDTVQCRACKFCYGSNSTVPYCDHPDLIETDRIGDRKSPPCGTARMGVTCGLEGRLFEPRPIEPKRARDYRHHLTVAGLFAAATLLLWVIGHGPW